MYVERDFHISLYFCQDYSTRLQRTGRRSSKKFMFDIEPRNVADIISCFVCCPSDEDFI